MILLRLMCGVQLLIWAKHGVCEWYIRFYVNGFHAHIDNFTTTTQYLLVGYLPFVFSLPKLFEF